MKMVPLSDVIASAQPGFASGKNDPDGVAQIRMNNIGVDGSLNWDQIRRVPATGRQLQRLTLKEGDVLFNGTNSPDLVGKSAFFEPIDEPVVFSNHFLRLRTDNKRLEPRYLARWLTRQWQHRVFHGLCTRWVNQASVRKDDLLALKIPLPPLPEQKRIAAILDKADAIRRKRRQALELADQFLRSVFLDMFGDPVTNPKGWSLKKFSDVCDTRLGKMLDAKQQTGNHSRKYLRNANVQWNRFNLDDLLEMDFDEKDRNTFELRNGDVLICEGGEVGRSAIWRNQLDECYFQKALHRARPKSKVATPEYVMFLMRLLADYGGLIDSTASATIAHLTGAKLKNLSVPVPGYSHQQRFSLVFRRYEDSVSAFGQLESTVNELFYSLTQRAFRGEL